MNSLLLITLKVHLASTCVMVGLIWTVQSVHYPLFAQVGTHKFVPFHAAHVRRISLLVAPLMIVEAASGLLVLALLGFAPGIGFGLSLLLLLIAWGATWLIQVPQHQRLSTGYSAPVQRALVRGNWIRTAAWTGRALLLPCLAPGAAV